VGAGFLWPQPAASRRAVYEACSAREFASTGTQWVSGQYYGLALSGKALKRLLASWSSLGDSTVEGGGRSPVLLLTRNPTSSGRRWDQPL
jgi:hypothetical protein